MVIKLVLADDHPAVLSGLESVLSKVPLLRVVGKARNSSELLEVLDTLTCDVLLCDYSMPGGKFGDGMQMLSHVHRRYPKIKTIVFTMLEKQAIPEATKRLGVKSVLHKSVDIQQLVATIQAVYGGRVPSPVAASVCSAQSEEQAGLTKLSHSELEVLRLYVGGACITQIACLLNRTKQTVSTQKASIMQKLGLQRDAEMFRFAYRSGISEVGWRLAKPEIKEPSSV